MHCKHTDAMPPTQQGFRFAYGTVTRRRPATAAELQSMDLSSLVAVTQDTWHVKRRIRQAIPAGTPDRHLMEAAVSRVLAFASNEWSEPIVAATPRDLQSALLLAASQLRNQFLELISRFETRQSEECRQQLLHTALKDVAAQLASGDSNAEAAPLTVDSELQVAQTAVRSSAFALKSFDKAVRIEAVLEIEVRSCCFCLAHSFSGPG